MPSSTQVVKFACFASAFIQIFPFHMPTALSLCNDRILAMSGLDPLRMRGLIRIITHCSRSLWSDGIMRTTERAIWFECSSYIYLKVESQWDFNIGLYSVFLDSNHFGSVPFDVRVCSSGVIGSQAVLILHAVTHVVFIVPQLRCRLWFHRLPLLYLQQPAWAGLKMGFCVLQPILRVLISLLVPSIMAVTPFPVHLLVLE